MESIKKFLCSGSGYGDGSGYGSGDDDGSGYGSGYDYGDGDGSGYGYGYGDGSGHGDGSGYGSGDGDGSGYDYGDGYGDGSGSGDGSGYDYGYGDGSGHGYGSGYGSGSGSGYDYGDGDGSGIKSFCRQDVYMIDEMQTIIDQAHGNIARGSILHADMTTSPCFVVKHDNVFAHGETLRKAQSALEEKLFEDMPEAERIDAFCCAFREDKEYQASDFFRWHNKLTGSCEMGRRAFARDHGIDIDKDSMTVDEFLELTKDAYGGSVIRKVVDARKGV